MGSSRARQQLQPAAVDLDALKPRGAGLGVRAVLLAAVPAAPAVGVARLLDRQGNSDRRSGHSELRRDARPHGGGARSAPPPTGACPAAHALAIVVGSAWSHRSTQGSPGRWSKGSPCPPSSPTRPAPNCSTTCSRSASTRRSAPRSPRIPSSGRAGKACRAHPPRRPRRKARKWRRSVAALRWSLLRSAPDAAHSKSLRAP